MIPSQLLISLSLFQTVEALSPIAYGDEHIGEQFYCDIETSTLQGQPQNFDDVSLKL
jgi:hypothetical protein